MPREKPLPIDASFENADVYVQSLLSFVTSSEVFARLCGGVHILEFLTNEPDLYESVLPQEWRHWFQVHGISVILHLLMREDIETIVKLHSRPQDDCDFDQTSRGSFTWRNKPCPPPSLLKYISNIRTLSLDRKFERNDSEMVHSAATNNDLPRHVAVGMKPKKIHEVHNFTKYINDLISVTADSSADKITHIVDFGSGQNYLGRTLACPPYNKSVIALESKELNIRGARTKDVTAKLAEKQKIMRNKKEFRLGFDNSREIDAFVGNDNTPKERIDPVPQKEVSSLGIEPIENANTISDPGTIQYIETNIRDGNLASTLKKVKPDQKAFEISNPRLMVVSLHSCGNLVHHGLRSLVINDSVKTVAMVGCCYNLMTERLGPPTYKTEPLRIANKRLQQTSSACDPHGFPMSERLATYKHQNGEGIRMNITARMMAVQAPQNWSAMDCESFFTKHFYRALLQRIFLDRGIIFQKTFEDSRDARGSCSRDRPETSPAITIGSLRKGCYASFVTYVRGAAAKLAKEGSGFIAQSLECMSDDEILQYECQYEGKRKELSVVWSLMAFSASVVESLIVTDRWLYLREQPQVKDCWVETVFEYEQSPRNLVVVGVKG